MSMIMTTTSQNTHSSHRDPRIDRYDGVAEFTDYDVLQGQVVQTLCQLEYALGKVGIPLFFTIFFWDFRRLEIERRIVGHTTSIDE